MSTSRPTSPGASPPDLGTAEALPASIDAPSTNRATILDDRSVVRSATASQETQPVSKPDQSNDLASDSDLKPLSDIDAEMHRACDVATKGAESYETQAITTENNEENNKTKESTQIGGKSPRKGLPPSNQEQRRKQFGLSKTSSTSTASAESTMPPQPIHPQPQNNTPRGTPADSTPNPESEPLHLQASKALTGHATPLPATPKTPTRASSPDRISSVGTEGSFASAVSARKTMLSTAGTPPGSPRRSANQLDFKAALNAMKQDLQREMQDALATIEERHRATVAKLQAANSRLSGKLAAQEKHIQRLEENLLLVMAGNTAPPTQTELPPQAPTTTTLPRGRTNSPSPRPPSRRRSLLRQKSPSTKALTTTAPRPQTTTPPGGTTNLPTGPRSPAPPQARRPQSSAHKPSAAKESSACPPNSFWLACRVGISSQQAVGQLADQLGANSPNELRSRDEIYASEGAPGIRNLSPTELLTATCLSASRIEDNKARLQRCARILTMLGEDACLFTTANGEKQPLMFFSTGGNKWLSGLPARALIDAHREVEPRIVLACKQLLKASCCESRAAYPETATNNPREGAKANLMRILNYVASSDKPGSTLRHTTTEGEKQ